MTTSEIVNLIIAVVSVIPTLVSVVCLIVNIIKTKNWNLVMDIADAAMREVEEYSRTHPGMSADDKLNMALKAVETGLSVAGIKCDTALLKRIIDYIKQSITWFNEMNDKDAK